MNFKEIYSSSAAEVKEALTSIFCGECNSPAQKAYAEQLKELVNSKLFADESVFPVVQGMEFYESVEKADEEKAINLIGEDLWKKTGAGSGGFPPYMHQYTCWRNLLIDRKSIVVTTGTGSGKTECFMLPLVRDLIDNPVNDPKHPHQIRALFLYPLNALMEDQKKRMADLLRGTGLRFAVYNGNLPENKDDENAEEIQYEIDSYGDCIVTTRSELHSTPPDIILTNPTMLEYMLLRDKDQKLFSYQSLKWIVVDEAHTFTGAGAAELAMLIRRVVNAFGIDTEKDLRFAASSATIGKGSGDNLKQFISDISGISANKVEVVVGEKKIVPDTGDAEVDRCRKVLRERDFIPLDKLIPQGRTIEEKLGILDDLCSPQRGLRAKVHYFFRVPNNGIRAQLDNWKDHSNGILKLLDRIPEGEGETPALEMKRCKHCGEEFFIAEVSSQDNTYRACTREYQDLFGSPDGQDGRQMRIIGVVDKNAKPIDGNKYISICGNTYAVDNAPSDSWVFVANDSHCCPHCGHSLVPDSQGTAMAEDVNEEGEQESDGRTINDYDIRSESFRVSSEFISRTLAPVLLRELGDTDSKRDAEKKPRDPHHGQQFISFVDSRQTAAQSTFKQNLEVEKDWVYSRLFNRLCELQKDFDRGSDDIPELRRRLDDIDPLSDEYDVVREQYRAAVNRKKKGFASMSWGQVFDYLSIDRKDESDIICKQFVNQEDGKEISSGKIDPLTKERYLFSVMIEQLSKYPPFSATAETMGLIESYYPALDELKAPQAFRIYNSMASAGEMIPDDRLDAEWRNLLKIYIDRVARSNETIFMRLDNHLDSDIFNCGNRFGLKKPSRRTARKPVVRDANGTLPIIHILLAKMLGANESNVRDILRSNKDQINAVINGMWEQLINCGLLQYSTHIKKDKNRPHQIGATKATDWKEDKDTQRDRERYEGMDDILDPEGRQLRFNVSNLHFRLPKTVYIAKVLEGRKTHLRPSYLSFNGYMPYNIKNDVCKPVDTQVWDTAYPFFNGIDPIGGKKVTKKQISEWTSANRGVLYKNGIMGADGCFDTHLTSIYSFPDVFIQAEHTAQVNKKISKASQLLFKDHKINILACSTTMEMGVDLGDLDLVVMSSIPPHPANYKQRAGRSGRNTGNKSACITLCTSDVVGLRVLHHPLEALIERPVSDPAVDLDCPAIIQRHANAFLIRESGLFFHSPGSRTNLSLEVVDCFSNYEFGDKQIPTKNGGVRLVPDYWKLIDKLNNGADVYPKSNNPLGEKEGTIYENFREWLINKANPSDLKFILDGTSLAGKESQVVYNCLEEWESRYHEIEEDLAQIGGDYEEAYQSAVQAKRSYAKFGELKTAYGNKLRWEFYHLLRKKLIDYLATHRFTPNANMPVDVIEFNVNSAKASSPWAKNADNPSYQLRQALSQYAPGNCVVRENRVLTVAGVDYIGKNRDKDPLKSFFTDGKDVVDSAGRLKNSPVSWPVSGKNELQLVQAKSFIPDINSQDSRIMESSPVTHVSAQLIGADPWGKSYQDSSHLAVLRSSSQSGNAKILYYNEGIGYGYCLCGRCGKMVLEIGPGNSYANIPDEMTSVHIQQKGSQDEYCGHYAIDRNEDNGEPRFCTPFHNKYFRNVILGDLIQTDYCEIHLRDAGNPFWIDDYRNNNYKSLLVTLGILFCKVFTGLIGKEPRSVDFLLMPTGTLCIYDTNPGGSGYSNKLADPQMFRQVVEGSAIFINGISSKDDLLDKYTLQHLNDIDVDWAARWLEAEIDSWRVLPSSVADSGIKAAWATMSDIVSSIDDTTSVCRLFISEDWKKWHYQANGTEENGSNTLKFRLELLRKTCAAKQVGVDVVAIMEDPSNPRIPAVLYDEILEMKGWLNGGFFASKNPLAKGMIPLAIVDDRLFFTDSAESSAANGEWGRGNVFMADLPAIDSLKLEKVDLTHRPGTQAVFMLPMNGSFSINGNAIPMDHINSDQIYDLVSVLSKKNSVDMDSFIHSFASSGDRLEITYQDEHMKSGFGILAAYQFILRVIERADKKNNFSLIFQNEEYWDNSSRSTTFYPSKGLADDKLRGELVEYFSDQLYELLETDKDCCPFNNETLPSNSLPHWRVLTLKCGKKQISIYPNGGFINEWMFDSRATADRYSDNSELNIEEPIPLFRKKEIKYEVIIDKQ